jgi:hypothetical protein
MAPNFQQSKKASSVTRFSCFKFLKRILGAAEEK